MTNEIVFGSFIFIFPQRFAHTSRDWRSGGFDDNVSQDKLIVAAFMPMFDDRYAESQIAPGGHLEPSIYAGLSLLPFEFR
jgi:hypothetical protein